MSFADSLDNVALWGAVCSYICRGCRRGGRYLMVILFLLWSTDWCLPAWSHVQGSDWMSPVRPFGHPLGGCEVWASLITPQRALLSSALIGQCLGWVCCAVWCLWGPASCCPVTSCPCTVRSLEVRDWHPDLVFLVSAQSWVCSVSLPADSRLCFVSIFAEVEGQPLWVAVGGQGAGFAVVPWMQSGRRADVFAPP